MTRNLFGKILNTWNKTFKKQNKRIFVIIDNCLSHKNLDYGLYPNIQKVYLSANSTSILQSVSRLKQHLLISLLS